MVCMCVFVVAQSHTQAIHIRVARHSRHMRGLRCAVDVTWRVAHSSVPQEANRKIEEERQRRDEARRLAEAEAAEREERRRATFRSEAERENQQRELVSSALALVPKVCRF